MAPCTAITKWPECAGSPATVGLVQATPFKCLHPCLPCGNGSNEPFSLSTSRRGKQDMTTLERSTGKQEEHWFLPRGLVLACILHSPPY